ncbi:biotin-dependent carboxyltransferase family protein [Gracilibacillus xinjiangensis]|uniref:Biotin-dependent carboxyltransferase family protein n=1 Tax=Gracilibacillus xinjiangensis TaxID=1193282 RepID=A0ABV8WPK5_9BACI
MIIIEEGIHTTIQDLGRLNYRSFGFSPGGPMDNTAMRLANYLVGNEDSEAVLEMCFMGPTIEFTCDTVIAITGAEITANLNGYSFPLHRPVLIRKGDILQCRACKQGIYAYLSIKGGIRINKKLDSRSMIARLGNQDFLSRKLKTNDQLPIRPFSLKHKIKWKLDKKIFEYIHKDRSVIRFLEGPQYSWFNKNHLTETFWQVSPKSNRMGYRLIGNKVETLRNDQLLTEPVQFGAIQVPPGGEPIVLMADGQPTGGYPKIGQVIQVDLPALSQMTPTRRFTFEKCSMNSAIAQLTLHEKFLNQLKQTLLYKWREILKWN